MYFVPSNLETWLQACMAPSIVIGHASYTFLQDNMQNIPFPKLLFNNKYEKLFGFLLKSFDSTAICYI